MYLFFISARVSSHVYIFFFLPFRLLPCCAETKTLLVFHFSLLDVFLFVMCVQSEIKSYFSFVSNSFGSHFSWFRPWNIHHYQVFSVNSSLFFKRTLYIIAFSTMFFFSCFAIYSCWIFVFGCCFKKFVGILRYIPFVVCYSLYQHNISILFFIFKTRLNLLLTWSVNCVLRIVQLEIWNIICDASVWYIHTYWCRVPFNSIHSFFLSSRTYCLLWHVSIFYEMYTLMMLIFQIIFIVRTSIYCV